MNNKELLFLENLIKNLNLNDIYLSYHAKNNGITAPIEMIKDVLSKKNIQDLIIEYNETPTRDGLERRILIRNDELINVCYNVGSVREFSQLSNLCFVVCIDNCKIVTTYYNIAKDSHDTLDLKRYDASLKILK